MFRQTCSRLLVLFSALTATSSLHADAPKTSGAQAFEPLQVVQPAGEDNVAFLEPDRDILTALAAHHGPMRITLPLPTGESVIARVTPFEIASTQCRFIERSAAGDVQLPRPDVTLLRGDIEGRPLSHVFLSFTGESIGNGYIDLDGQRFFIATPRAAQGRAVQAGLMTIQPARPSDEGGETAFCGVDSSRFQPPELGMRLGSPPNNAGPRLSHVAIEADQTFVNLFPNPAACNAYILQLLAATTDIYLRDINLRLSVDFVRLWPAGGEPFGADDLAGFADYWVNFEDPSPFNLIHMLSARRDMSYAGIAYLGGTCDVGATYGISGFLNGVFPTSVGPPNLLNWDVIVPTHEMGHNCGTGHTHDSYTPKIDNCGGGVPSRGTIMSYCHTLPGGTMNIDMWMHRRVEDVIEADFTTGGCYLHDCNGNLIPDETEIAGNPALDANGDGVPDSCQDCNNNSILDPLEITPATDVNNNGVLDACEPDCNANGIPDPYECDLNPSIDVDGNNMPDSCQPDCNNNGIADFKDVATGGFADVERDNIPDVCQDCDANGTPDWIDLGRGENCYVCDRADYVREYHRMSGYPIQNLGAGAVLDPYDCTFGPDRQLYVASFANDRIIKINVDTGATSIFVAAGSGSLDGPSSLVFGSDGNLYVASNINSRILKYDGTTGAFISTFVAAGSGGLATPYGLTFGPNGNLFVTSSNNTVIQYNGTTGALVGTFVTAGSGGLSGPRGLVFKPDGNLLVASFTNARILQYNGLTGASMGQWHSGLTIDGAWGLRIGPDGNVYVVRSTGTIRVLVYRGDTGLYLRSYIRADTPLPTPTGFAFRPGFLHDCNGNRVLDACDPESSDLDLFVAQLLAAPPDPTLVCMLDQNADAQLNGADIPGFVAKLLAP